MQDNINKLYNVLKNDGYEDLGTEEKFRNFVNDSANVKKLYGVLKNDGYEDLGTEDQFISFVMPKQQASKPQGMIAAAIQAPEPPASIAKPENGLPLQKFNVAEQNKENAEKFRIQQEQTPLMRQQRAAKQQAEAMNKPAFPDIEAPQLSRSIGDDREKYKGMVTQAIRGAVKDKSETALSDAMRNTNEELARQGYDVEALQQSGLLNEAMDNVLVPSAEAAVTKGRKIIDKVFDDAKNKALKARTEATRYNGMGGTGMMGAGLLMGEKAYNKEIDPDKLQQQLVNAIDKDGLRETFNEVYRQAVRYGIDPKEYFNSYVAPHLKANAARALDKFMTDQYMPKNDAEYILSGFSDSITGMLSDWLTKTASQNAYKQMALSKYEASSGTKIAREAVGLISSAPEFIVSGGAASAVTKKICGKAIQNMVAKGFTRMQAQRILTAELASKFGQRVAERIVQSSVSGSANFATLESMSEAARQLRDDDLNVGNIAIRGIQGAGKGAVFGAVSGGYAGATSELTGATKVISNFLGIPANGLSLTLSSNAINEVSKLMGGEDELVDAEGKRKPFMEQWADNTLLDLMMRATSHQNLNVVTKEGRSDIANRIRSFFSPLSESQQIIGKSFGSGISEEGKARLMGITGTDNLRDALMSGVPKASDMPSLPFQAGRIDGKTRSRSVDDLLRDEQRSVMQQNWDNIMHDRELTAADKAKLCMIMGAKYHANPSVTMTTVTGADGVKYVEYRDAAGMLNERKPIEDADISLDEQNRVRMQNIYSKTSALGKQGEYAVAAGAMRYAMEPDAEGNIPTEEQQKKRASEYFDRFRKGELTDMEITELEADLNKATLSYDGADKIKVLKHGDGTASVQYSKNGVPVRTDHFGTEEEANERASRDLYQQQLNSINEWREDVGIPLDDGSKLSIEQVYELKNNMPLGTLQQAIEGYPGMSMDEVRDKLLNSGLTSVDLVTGPDGIIRTAEQDKLIRDYYDWAKKTVEDMDAKKAQPDTEGLYQMGEGGTPDSITPAFKAPETPITENGPGTEAPQPNTVQEAPTPVQTSAITPRTAIDENTSHGKAYTSGYNAVSANDLTTVKAIKDNHELAVRRVNNVVTNTNPVIENILSLTKQGKHAEAHALVDSTPMPEEHADALSQYIDADASMDGMQDAVEQIKDARIREYQAMVEAQTQENGEDVTILMLDGKKTQSCLVNGDLNNMSGTVMIRDLDENGNPVGDAYQVHVKNIKRVFPTQKVKDMIFAERKRIQQDIDAYFDNAVSPANFEPGKKVALKDGDSITEATVIGVNPDGSINFQSDAGEVQAISRADAERMATDAKEANYDIILKTEEEARRQAQQQPEAPKTEEKTIPLDEKTGKKNYIADGVRPVDAVNDIYNRGIFSTEQADAYVQAKIDAAQKEYDKVNEPIEPKDGEDPDDYAVRQQAHDAEVNAAKEVLDRWQAIKDEAKRQQAEAREAERQRKEAERKAAEQARIELENNMKAQAKAMGTDEPVAHNQRAVSKGGLVIDEQSVGIDSGTATTLDAIGKALGVEIRIDNSLTTGNGMWSPGRGKNGLNLISIKSDTNTALSFLYGHEITHEIKNATQGNDKLWQGFVQAVRKAVGEAEFDARVKEAQERWNEEIKKYNEDLKAKGRTDFASLLDEAGATEEVCCDFVGERIISDKDFANRLLEEVEKSGESSASIAQRIRDFIDKVLKAMREIVNPTDEQRRQIEGLEQAKKIWGDLYEYAAAKEREKRAEQAEAERQRKEEELRRKQEARKRAIEKYDKPINDARKRMGDDPDALAVMEDGNREPKTLKEAVAQMIPAHSLVLKNWTDANGRQHLGLEGETGFKHADLSRFSTFIGKRENGAVDIATLAERIYENLPEDMRQQAPDADRDIRNVIIELFSEAEKADDILHYVDNARIREAEAVYQRNKDREAYEAEREAYGQKAEATDGAPEYDASQDPFAGMDTEDKFSIRKKPEPKPIGTGSFGEIYDQFKGKPKEAIAFLLKKKSGEAIGALHHKDIGDIDLVWGVEGSGHSDGFGLAKLAKYHPEVLENLQELLDDMVVTKRSANRVQLENDTHQAAIRLTWDNKKKTWLLTAFEKKNSALDNTTDTGKTSERGKRNDTATPQSTVFSESKGTDKSANIQTNADKSATESGNSQNVPSGDSKFSIAQRDKEYADAVAAGDKEKVDAMLREEAERKGYSEDSSYQGSIAFNGAAPSRNGYFETRQERKEAFDNGDFEDTYSLGDYVETGLDNHDLEWQLANPIPASGRDKATLESIRNLSNAVKSKSGKIKMYRAVDADIKEGSFRNGDWITPSREYAQKHIGLQDWKKGRVIEQEVSIDDVWWDGNDINEWGYDDGKGYVYKNTENNRKLLEATYDDKGNLIPLSKRFDEKKSDVKFSMPPKKNADGDTEFSYEGDPKFSIRVFHGSGADFEKFDHKFMGTGEGNQSFGWGTYVTEVEGVGRQYAEDMGNSQTYKGKVLESNPYSDNPADRALFYAEQEHGADKAIKFLKELMKEEEDADTKREYQECIDVLRDKKSWGKSERHIYEVEIPDDNGRNYIDWKAPLTEENKEDIRAGLIKDKFFRDQEQMTYDDLKSRGLDVPDFEEWLGLRADVLTTSYNGEDFYKGLSQALGGNQIASEFLRDCGFTGIKYPVNAMSGGNSEGTHNYVIFNENDAQIVNNTKFSFPKKKEDKTLMGVHNISEDKLKKALKLGGLANPSLAVIDTEKQSHTGFGNISLIPKSSLIDAKTGRNAGTYLGDAWTPTYPSVTKSVSKQGEAKIKAIAKEAAGNDEALADHFERGIHNFVEGNGNNLAFLFLKQKGLNPEIKQQRTTHSHEEYEQIEKIFGEGTTQMPSHPTDEQNKALFDMMVARRKAELEKRAEKISDESKREAAVKVLLDDYKQDIADENGKVWFAKGDTFVNEVARDERRRKFNPVDWYGTDLDANNRVASEGLYEEYNKWRDSLLGDEDINEELFAGWTKDGYKRYVPNTVENASRLMNKQAETNSNNEGGIGATKSSLLKKVSTLSAIRKNKGKLQDAETVSAKMQEASDELLDMIHQLADKQKVDDNRFINMDIAENRLQEALAERNPVKYLNKEYRYNIDENGEYAQQIKDFIKMVGELPAKYFETKFRRPVGLDEFAVAVVPEGTSEEVIKGLKDAGLDVRTYDGTEENRKAVTMNAVNGREDIKFSVAIERSDPFYSNAAKATEDIRQEKATGDQWLAMIKKNGGLKAEEDKWMGLSDWLKDKKSVTKAELQKFIADNAVEIEDVEYAEVNDLDNNPKMQQFQKEYGEALDKYRKEEEAIDKEMEAFDNEMFEKYGEGWANDLKKLSEEDRKRNRELTSRYDMLKDNDIEQLAFGDMIEEYGDDFGQAFEIDYGVNKIVPVMDMYDDNLSDAAKYFLEFEQEPINTTRLGYTTEGLENKREIALVVPDIEPYNAHDEIHFGDAGGGRAVAWIRFGDTETHDPEIKKSLDSASKELYDYLDRMSEKYETNPDNPEQIEDKLTAEEKAEHQRIMANIRKYDEANDANTKKVLVIDEIQSKRHQDGREKGYIRDSEKKRAALREFRQQLLDKYNTSHLRDVERQATAEELQKLKELDEAIVGVPDAPFQKTWHELAMKRMLRYAAENGYDKIAWTTGEQQAERYNLREKVDEIKVANAYDTDAHEPVFTVIGRKDGGILVQEDVVGEKGMAELLGKELARKAYSNLKEGKDDYLNEDGAVVFSGDNLAIGGEGMKGFYDRMLPQFMDKYGKKWGVKTGEVELDLPNEADRVMHSVDVTPEMKESVMKGQPKFSLGKKTPEEFDDVYKKAVENNGYVPEGIEKATVKVVGLEKHPFTGSGKQAIEKAREWAKNNLIGIHTANEGTPDEYKYKIEEEAIGKFLSGSSTKHSENLGLHLATLIKLPEIIENSIDAEIHPDYKKVDGVRSIANSIGKENMLVHRLYGAAMYDDETYRVKNTIKETRGGEGSAYDYKITKVELPISGSEASDALGNSTFISGANLLKDIVKSYEKDKKLIAQDADSQNVQSGDSKSAIYTDNFKKWFGDWENDPENASKVVDENGEPKVVLHGTPNRDFYEFKDEKIGSTNDSGWLGRGFYFYGNNPEYARQYSKGGRVMDVYLDIRNPYYATYEDMNRLAEANSADASREFREQLESEGYDGVFYNDDLNEEWVAFRPEQIKSATENNGNFDATNPDIRFSMPTIQKGDTFEDVVRKATELRKAAKERKDLQETRNKIQTAIAAAEAETNTEPTEAQKEAGNYKKGHFKIDGYDVTIENPKGSERSGTDASGKKWSITMNNTYGYIRGTEGVDGDHIDVFLSDDPTHGDVFVVDQVNDDGSFDEHKVMYGFPDIESARKAYLANYSEGWQGLGAITPVSKEEFKKWINSSHRKTKPFAKYSSVETLGDVMTENTAFSIRVPEGKTKAQMQAETDREIIRRRNIVREGDTYEEVIRKARAIRDADELVKIEQTISDNQIKPGDSFEEVLRKAEALKTAAEDQQKFSFSREERARQAYERDKKRQQKEINEAQKALRKKIVDEINYLMNDQHLTVFNKSTLSRLLKDVQNADADNIEQTVTSIRTDIDRLTDKSQQRQLEDLMKLKTRDQNGKGMAIAKNVSDSVRRILGMIQGRIVDLKSTGYEEDMTQLRRQNWFLPGENMRLRRTIERLRDEEPTAERTQDMIDAEIAEAEAKIKENEAQVEANKAELADLKVRKQEAESAKALASDADVAEEIAKLMEKMDEHVAGKGAWTPSDSEKLTALQILQLKQQADSKRREIENMKRKLAELEDSLSRYQAAARHPQRYIPRQRMEQLEQQIQGMKEAINQATSELIGQNGNLIDIVKELIDEGKSSLQNKIEVEKNRAYGILHGVVTDIAGDKQIPTDQQKQKNQQEEGKLKKFFSSQLHSFEYLAKRINENSLGEDGFFYNYFIKGKNGVMEAENNYQRGLRDAVDTLDAKAQEIYGCSFLEASEKTAEVDYHSGVFTYRDSDGMEIEEEQPLSKGQAMYIYMVWKMPDGKMKLQNQGFTDESLAQVREFLSPEDMQFADWIQDEFLKDRRAKYNDLYVELYNTSMGNIENYVPLKILETEVKRDSNLSDDSGRKQTLEEKAGALIERKFNLSPVDITQNAFAVIADHINNMEEWHAFARVRKDLDYVLSNTYVRKQLNANSAGRYNQLYDASAIAAHAYKPNKAEHMDEVVGWLTKGLVGGNIAFRNSTALKQILSVPAFYGYCEDPKFWAALTANIGMQYVRNAPAVLANMATYGISGKAGFKLADKGKMKSLMSENIVWCMKNVPSFRNRVLKGTVGLEYMDQKLKGKVGELVDKYLDYGMATNQMIDAITCSVGIKSIFDYRYAKLSQGIEKDTSLTAEQKAEALEEAKRQAIMDADIYYNATQQSNHSAFMSPMQLSRSMINRAFSVYQNASIGYARKAVSAGQNVYKIARNFSKLQNEYARRYMAEDANMDRDEAMDKAHEYLTHKLTHNILNAFHYGYTMNWLWDLGSKGLLGLWWWSSQRDEDKEKELRKEAGLEDNIGLRAYDIAAKAGELTAYPGRGLTGMNMASSLINGSLNNPLLLIDELDEMQQDVKKYLEDGNYAAIASQALFHGLKTSGFDARVHYNTLAGVYGMSKAALTGNQDSDFMINLMLALNTPNTNRRAVAEELYKDYPLDTYVSNIMEASKYTDNEYLALFPGMKLLTAKNQMQIYKEFAFNNLTDEERSMLKDVTKMKLDQLRTTAELTDAYNRETDVRTKEAIGRMIIKSMKDELSRNNTPEDLLKKAKESLLGKESATKNVIYTALCTSDDLVDDEMLKEAIAELKPVMDQLKEIEDEGTVDQEREYTSQHKEEIDEYERLKDLAKLISEDKRELKDATPEERNDLMNDIRELRNEALKRGNARDGNKNE